MNFNIDLLHIATVIGKVKNMRKAISCTFGYSEARKEYIVIN